jgi:hypothetical protein
MIEVTLINVVEAFACAAALWCAIYAFGWCATKYDRFMNTSRNYR